MPLVISNGMKTAYLESGTGEPLILLHGGHGSYRSFDFFRPLLGEGIRAIAYDQREAPENPYSGGPYDLRDLAEDCAAFIAAIGLKRAHLMGTSYGGTVALMTAIHFPECVQSLVLAATTPSTEMTKPALAPATSETDHAKIQRVMLEMLITPEAIDNDPELVAEVNGVVISRPADALARRFGALTNYECRSDLSRIQAPTLILHGEDDPVIKTEAAKYMAEHISQAELKLFPNARHGFTIQFRHRIAEMVRDFVLHNAMTKNQ